MMAMQLAVTCMCFKDCNSQNRFRDFFRVILDGNQEVCNYPVPPFQNIKPIYLYIHVLRTLQPRLSAISSF